ncbi:glycerophosphoryl diester phosphodiesterase [Bradyrhizobium sp. CIR48]|uniref:glycerophosphodiester phosphodiesterase n=1 Tax=Bradyrhizobium sp. CIR48 TaxID=2663840 RepID=UPI0016064449|nr:glycerophosphodiester phosphodiesterase [Bradyrhizobium sp. CIR48]MBB4428317.1 glycerophosphoryl diester phosphodiesterase [Bradyrhizobium sp. CIR48]
MSMWSPLRFELNRPVVIGHRGLPEIALENTKRSFELAIQTKCDAVEVDVHVASDGHVICLHDDDLLRVAGQDARASSLTLKEARALFPALLDYETFLSMTGSMPVMIDTKECSKEEFEVIADATERSGPLDRFMFSVMNFELAHIIRERWPQVAISAHAHRGLDFVRMAEEIEARFVRLLPEDCVPGQIARLHEEGYATLAVASPLSSTRTSTNPDALQTLADLGIRAIITDRCDWAMETLTKRTAA